MKNFCQSRHAYQNAWQCIDSNPRKWAEDKYSKMQVELFNNLTPLLLRLLYRLILRLYTDEALT